MKFLLRMLVVLLGLMSFLILQGSKCSSESAKVTVPASDSTPPTLRFIVTTDDPNDAAIDLTQASQAATLSTNADFANILVGGTDKDGGVKKIELWRSVTKFKTGVVQGPGLVGRPFKENNTGAGVGDQVPTIRRITHKMDLDAGLGSFDRIRYQMWVTVENFHGHIVTSPTVTINFP
ncbi:MAG: hypothetical protein ACRBF0_13915 [Calditrichia bacterium]